MKKNPVNQVFQANKPFPFLTKVTTDETKEYSNHQLIELNYQRNGDRDQFSHLTLPLDGSSPLALIHFPDITGCHIVIGIDRVSEKLWFSHVSIAQCEENKVVPRGYAIPPPAYSQLLAESYPDNAVGISSDQKVDFMIICRPEYFDESLFRKVLGGRVGEVIQVTRDFDGLVQIFYDLNSGKVYFLPDRRNPAMVKEVHYSPLIMREVFSSVSEFRSESKILELVSEYIGDTSDVADISKAPDMDTLHYLEDINRGKVRPHYIEVMQHLNNIQKRCRFPQEIFDEIKLYYESIWAATDCPIHSLAIHQVGVSFLENPDLLFKTTGIELLTYAAEELYSKQAAFFLAELYANRRDDKANLKIDYDENKALHFLQLAARNGSSTAKNFLELNGEEAWFISPNSKLTPSHDELGIKSQEADYFDFFSNRANEPDEDDSDEESFEARNT